MMFAERLRASRAVAAAMVIDEASAVDIPLYPGHRYEQVVAQTGARHGVLDLLAVTRARRLAILELKAAENPDLPLETADYWARLRWRQAQRDLARSGYFPGLQLQCAAACVSPGACAFIRALTRCGAIFRQRSKSSGWG